MNRLLASLLSAFNGVFALLIALGFVLIGYADRGAEGGWIGLFVGIVAATFTCGLIAVLLVMDGRMKRMEEHLKHLADSADYQNKLMQIGAERQATPKT